MAALALRSSEPGGGNPDLGPHPVVSGQELPVELAPDRRPLTIEFAQFGVDPGLRDLQSLIGERQRLSERTLTREMLAEERLGLTLVAEGHQPALVGLGSLRREVLDLMLQGFGLAWRDHRAQLLVESGALRGESLPLRLS